MSKERYYVNKNAQSNGDHEVHKTGCKYMPHENNRRDLGEFYSCDDAVKEAKKTYKQSNGCEECCEECHTS